MSSLIFYTDPQQALVVTDSLAVNPDGSPKLFCSKALYLPHLRTIVAGTGASGFSGDWAMRANGWMLIGGIENLNFHTPAGLRDLWSSYVSAYSIPPDMTTTVYYFGFSEDSGQMTSFAYRSTSDFASERLEHGVGVKPECAVPDGNLYDFIPEMMTEQRSIQASKPEGKRLYIGGSAFAMHLTLDCFTCSKVFDFPDFSEQFQQALTEHASRL